MTFLTQVKLKLRELEGPRFDGALCGAHTHCAGKVFPGVNLFDGQLIDLQGKEFKKWKSRYLGVLLADGRYVAQEHYESCKWGMYTWDDEVIWEKDFPIHHDIVLTPQETIITLTKETHHYKGRDVDFCAVVEFDFKGQELTRWSTWENLGYLQKFHPPLELDVPKLPFWPDGARRKAISPWGGHYDYYHINSFQLLPRTPLAERDHRFREGNWLISFRHGSMVFILDGETREVVWQCIGNAIAHGLEGQHAPAMLADGRILIFDNGRYRGWSRVLELDPVSMKILWEYRGDGFYTLSQGHAQRLGNGNTLVTQSEAGRAFEITREGEIVWEYYHPEVQNASNSTHPESFGRRQWIYRMVRYDLQLVL